MNKDNFEFHRRLPLQKITEDLPYRLAGIKKEKPIINDSSSESSDDFFTKSPNKNLLNDQKKIKKDYAFRKKKKKLDYKDQNSKTLLLNRQRIDVSLHFNKSINNFYPNYDNKKHFKSNYSKYNVDSIDERSQNSNIYNSNFDSTKSDGFKNLYPFLTEFDYESEEDKYRRECLKNMYVHGTPLVPSSCKELQVPSEIQSFSIFQKQPSMSLFNKSDNNEEKYSEIENWQLFLKNDSYSIHEDNSNPLLSSPLEKIDQLDNPSNLSNSQGNSLHISNDSGEASKFKELLKHSKPKTITIGPNLQDKVSNRVTMKKKMTAAIHNSSITSHTQPVIPFSWPSAKKSLVVKRHETPLQTYLENRNSAKLMNHDEIISLGKTLEKFETQRKIAKEKQRIPDWAKGTSQPILMTAPKKTKVIVKSKYMNENDYLA